MTSTTKRTIIVGFPLSDPYAGRPTTYGVVQPDGTNTGTVSSVTITRTSHTGDLTLSTPGDENWINYDFHGRVKVNSSGRKYFKNCWFYGNGALTSNTACLDCTNANVTNVIAEDCTMIPTTPTLWQDGIIGHHYTATRCNVQYCADGFGVYNTSDPTGDLGVTIQMCYVTNFGWWYPDPNQSDGTHSDGIQIQGGANMQVLGNYIHGYYNTSIGTSPWGRLNLTTVKDPLHHNVSNMMYTPNVGAITNTFVDKNWFYGSEIAVNASSSGNNGNNIGTWTNNIFGKGTTYYAGYTLDFYHGATWTQSGNLYDDSSAITIHTP